MAARGQSSLKLHPKLLEAYSEGGHLIRRFLVFPLIACLLPLAAAAQEKEQDRLKEAGSVLQEILDVPDNITGAWGPPAMYALEGANIGVQLGGQATDFVLLIMNPKGADSVLSSKVKLGADAAAAAGPKGRDATAATDVVMRAEILSYSRSRGLFAGVRWKARRCARTTAPTRTSTDAK
jgi:hypothetical protein